MARFGPYISDHEHHASCAVRHVGIVNIPPVSSIGQYGVIGCSCARSEPSTRPYNHQFQASINVMDGRKIGLSYK